MVRLLFGNSTAGERKQLVVFIILCVLLREAYVLLFVDLSSDYYWEYGEIAKNIHAGKGYSLFYFDGKGMALRFNPSASPAPSAYMPPGYVVYLFPFFYVEDVMLRNVMILFSQIGISTLGMLACYVFTRRFFSPRASLYAAAISALLPEFIYVTSSFTPTVLFHLGVIVLFYRLYDLKRDFHVKDCVLTGVICAALIYLRSEVVLFVAIVVVYLARKSNLKTAASVAFVVMLFLLPWQVRNYSVFDQWVPLTTNFGLNFFRGHSDAGYGDRAEGYLSAEAPKIAYDSQLEIELNKLYLRTAREVIVADPGREVGNSLVKLMNFWIWNPDDERATNPLYFIPWLAMLILAVVGMVHTSAWRMHMLPLLFVACSTLIAILFFALPRYQTMMKIVLVPFVAVGIEVLRQKVAARWHF